MRALRTLRARLLASHLIVAAAGVITFVVIAAVAAPTFFHGHVAHGGGMMDGSSVEIERAFDSALRRAFVVAVGASAAAAVVVVSLVVRRILRPVDRIRSATRRLAGGDYRERVDPPAEVELAALAADVNALAASLEMTERGRMQLMADVSHELRTPLTAIEGFMEGLIDGVVPAEAETYASVAEEAARLKRLAEDLSALSRSDEPEGLRQEIVDLGSLTEKVAQRLQPQFDDKQVELVVDLPALLVVGDPDRLTQVIVNVLGNALGNTPAGGRVAVTGRADRGRVVLTINDTGIGIEERDLERIFERFYRATSSRSHGTGIGLTIARGIARSHRGDLTAQSEGLGRGSTFTLALPAV